MEKYLQMSDEDKAIELSGKVKQFTELKKDSRTIDEPPVTVSGHPGFFVTIDDGIDYLEYSDYIVNISDNRPDLEIFQKGLKENYDREEDGRNLVKILITMLDSGLGGAPQSQIAVLFKEMGWVRAMLKEGFFETAYYELVSAFAQKNLLPPDSVESIRIQVLEVAQKYNPDFNGTVS